MGFVSFLIGHFASGNFNWLIGIYRPSFFQWLLIALNRRRKRRRQRRHRPERKRRAPHHRSQYVRWTVLAICNLDCIVKMPWQQTNFYSRIKWFFFLFSKSKYYNSSTISIEAKSKTLENGQGLLFFGFNCRVISRGRVLSIKKTTMQSTKSEKNKRKKKCLEIYNLFGVKYRFLYRIESRGTTFLSPLFRSFSVSLRLLSFRRRLQVIRIKYILFSCVFHFYFYIFYVFRAKNKLRIEHKRSEEVFLSLFSSFLHFICTLKR